MKYNPKLYFLDVGHGNCIILKDTEGVAIFDCAPGIILLSVLSALKIKEIEAIFISHADHDHLGGIINLLLDPDLVIHKIYINLDATKSTETWLDFRIALRDAKRKGYDVHVYTSLTTETDIGNSLGEVIIEVLAPAPEIALGGPGSQDLENNPLDSNSASAVIRLLHRDHPVALLPGDIDLIGLNNLLSEKKDIAADIIVFPHHGGHPGGKSPIGFSKVLCEHVMPKLVIFSIDRQRFQNPLPEIVQGIRSTSPLPHIICTQLSKRCMAANHTIIQKHMNLLPAKGATSNNCCGGSIVVDLQGKRSTYLPNQGHKRFVLDLSKKAGTPLCIA